MRQIVEIADLKVGRVGDELVTFALGSCLGLTVYDPEAKVGCLLHAMLPDSAINPEKARENPFMFVDTGVPETLRRFYSAGGRKESIVVKAIGCASPVKMPGFKIGDRSFAVLRQLLKARRIALLGSSIGGSFSRTVFFDVKTGKISIEGRNSEVL